tara:strand:- start:446 stop:958 length:513 start_codon:yes stop_codon:yes gene_type:complete
MIILGIGSNLTSSYGNRLENIDLAVSFLEKFQINIIKKSSYYETPSYPNKKNPKFINIIIGIEGKVNPDELASIIMNVEEKLERKRGVKNDPRTCDIDIIDFEGRVVNFKYQNLDFAVPHKELIHRSFVLFPLAEILPNWKHPVTKEPIKTLIEKLTEEDKNSILKINKT